MVSSTASVSACCLMVSSAMEVSSTFLCMRTRAMSLIKSASAVFLLRSLPLGGYWGDMKSMAVTDLSFIVSRGAVGLQ